MKYIDANTAFFFAYDATHTKLLVLRWPSLTQLWSARHAPAPPPVALPQVDDLENPCLDYVEHIVFAKRSGVAFEAGGRSFASFAAVKAAFLGGALSEGDLKNALVESVDALVAPVRDHFASDPEARALLARIAE